MLCVYSLLWIMMIPFNCSLLFLFIINCYTYFVLINCYTYFVQLLTSSVELIAHQPSLFVNLQSLTIYPVKELSEYKKEASEKVNMSTEVKNYFLDRSPDATFSMVSREVFTWSTIFFFIYLSYLLLRLPKILIRKVV